MSLSTWRALALLLAVLLFGLGLWGGQALHDDHFATHQRGFSGCDAGWKACRIESKLPATDEYDPADDESVCGAFWVACYDANAEQ